MATSGRRRKPKFKCRGPRDSDGRACQIGVGQPGQRCKKHTGRPEVPPGGRLSEYIKRAPQKAPKKAQLLGHRSETPKRHPAAAQPRLALSRRAREALITEAVTYVQATIASNAIDAAIDRAAEYSGDKIWSGLTRDRHGRNCEELARLARTTLTGKDWIHDRIGQTAGSLLGFLGTPRIVRAFGKEIAKRIPMPWDHQLVVVARAMQIAGILICVLNDRDLAECECFVDVVISEGKERVAELIRKAAGNWRHLSLLTPSAP